MISSLLGRSLRIFKDNIPKKQMNSRRFLRNLILNHQLNDRLLSNNNLGYSLLVLILLRICFLKDISTQIRINLVKLIVILLLKLEESCMNQIIIKIKIVIFSLEVRNNILLLFITQTAIHLFMILVLLHRDLLMGFFSQQEEKHKVHFYQNSHLIQ